MDEVEGRRLTSGALRAIAVSRAHLDASIARVEMETPAAAVLRDQSIRVMARGIALTRWAVLLSDRFQCLGISEPSCALASLIVQIEEISAGMAPAPLPESRIEPWVSAVAAAVSGFEGTGVSADRPSHVERLVVAAGHAEVPGADRAILLLPRALELLRCELEAHGDMLLQTETWFRHVSEASVVPEWALTDMAASLADVERYAVPRALEAADLTADRLIPRYWDPSEAGDIQRALRRPYRRIRHPVVIPAEVSTAAERTAVHA